MFFWQLIKEETYKYSVFNRVGPDLVFLAGCRISGACRIRPDMPDIRPDNPAKFKIRPDNLAGYPAK